VVQIYVLLANSGSKILWLLHLLDIFGHRSCSAFDFQTHPSWPSRAFFSDHAQRKTNRFGSWTLRSYLFSWHHQCPIDQPKLAFQVEEAKTTSLQGCQVKKIKQAKKINRSNLAISSFIKGQILKNEKRPNFLKFFVKSKSFKVRIS